MTYSKKDYLLLVILEGNYYRAKCRQNNFEPKSAQNCRGSQVPKIEVLPSFKNNIKFEFNIELKSSTIDMDLHVLEITELTNVNKDKCELPPLGLESLLLTIV